MRTRTDPDVVVVGAGVAGGALGRRLARDGFSVLILERTKEHVDRIRGEWLAPWGVQEADGLGVLDVLHEAGGHYVSKSLRYGDGIPIETARARPLDLSGMVPGIPGVMMLGHPRMCEALDRAAQSAGATLLRGVSGVAVEPGWPPRIAFEHQGEQHVLRPGLVVGADGRGSSVARQIGAVVRGEPIHHLLGGLLVDGVHGWPEDEQTVSVHNGAALLIFPQGRGRVRLYLCYPVEQSGSFAGPQAAGNFLERFRVPSLPYSDEIVNARVIGPCQGYPNADTWVDEPVAAGVVLIGDAAGHNDPTIGQGLSITMRDARLVAEALAGREEWDDALFRPYAAERRERMRRLRINARMIAKVRAEFDDAAARLRTVSDRRAAVDPDARLPLHVAFKGPFGVPDETFCDHAVKKLFGEDWAMTDDGWPVQTTPAAPPA